MIYTQLLVHVNASNLHLHTRSKIYTCVGKWAHVKGAEDWDFHLWILLSMTRPSLIYKMMEFDDQLEYISTCITLCNRRSLK